MRGSRLEILAGTGVILLLLGTGSLGPEPLVPSPVSADQLVHAIAAHRTSLIDFYLSEHLDPNARAAQDRPLILAAALQQDWATVRRLLDAGASVDLADQYKLTPLMIAAMEGKIDMIHEFIGRALNLEATDRVGRSALYYAIASRKTEAVNLLLSVMPVLEPTSSGRLLELALDTGDEKIVGAIAQRLPSMQNWTSATRRALGVALSIGDRDLVRLLLKKHAAAPTPEGKRVPLLAYAIASHDSELFKTLLECGADPNTTLPPHYDNDFLGILPAKGLRNYIEDDKNVTVLMLAAGLGQPEFVQALIDAGANRDRVTGRYKMLALYLAAETGQWRCTQILLGSGPAPERLRIEISLASQHVSLLKDDIPVFSSTCSTGRSGYSTRIGDYVITDKERNHRSTIYKVEMPYFMRLSCLDFGMHEGVVPHYPASHGCIRLPGDAARKFFAEIPIGTLVSVK
jgi:ankyrin repeat protein